MSPNQEVHNMDLSDLTEYRIIDAHMHPYLAKDRDFPFDVPATYDEFFAEQRRAGGGSRISVARSGESAERHPVESALKREYRLSSLDLSRQLERGLHRVRPGGSREHYFIVK